MSRIFSPISPSPPLFPEFTAKTPGGFSAAGGSIPLDAGAYSAGGSSSSSPLSVRSAKAMEMTRSSSSLKRMTMTPWVERPQVLMVSTAVRSRMPFSVRTIRSSVPSTTLTPTTFPVLSVRP